MRFAETPASAPLWVRLETVDTFKYLFSDFVEDGFTSQGSLGAFNVGSSFYWFQAYTDGTRDWVIGSTPIELNQWYHLSAVRDDTAKTVRLFVNGAEEANLSYAGKSVVPLQGSKLLGGAGPSFPGDFMDGQLDEISVFNRALSAAEVESLFNGASAAGDGVVVNLPEQTATGVAGGIAMIQNVIGSIGNDILVGNGGNTLTGGAGRDLLIAGLTASTLIGGTGDDLVIGGTTGYDQTSLQAISNYWGGADDYATRVTNVTTGNGVPALKAGTVSDNAGVNTLTGGEGFDLFFGDDDSDTHDRDPLTEEFVTI